MQGIPRLRAAMLSKGGSPLGIPVQSRLGSARPTPLGPGDDGLALAGGQARRGSKAAETYASIYSEREKELKQAKVQLRHMKAELEQTKAELAQSLDSTEGRASKKTEEDLKKVKKELKAAKAELEHVRSQMAAALETEPTDISVGYDVLLLKPNKRPLQMPLTDLGANAVLVPSLPVGHGHPNTSLAFSSATKTPAPSPMGLSPRIPDTPQIRSPTSSPARPRPATAGAGASPANSKSGAIHCRNSGGVQLWLPSPPVSLRGLGESPRVKYQGYGIYQITSAPTRTHDSLPDLATSPNAAGPGYGSGKARGSPRPATPRSVLRAATPARAKTAMSRSSDETVLLPEPELHLPSVIKETSAGKSAHGYLPAMWFEQDAYGAWTHMQAHVERLKQHIVQAKLSMRRDEHTAEKCAIVYIQLETLHKELVATKWVPALESTVRVADTSGGVLEAILERSRALHHALRLSERTSNALLQTQVEELQLQLMEHREYRARIRRHTEQRAKRLEQRWLRQSLIAAFETLREMTSDGGRRQSILLKISLRMNNLSLYAAFGRWQEFAAKGRQLRAIVRRLKDGSMTQCFQLWHGHVNGACNPGCMRKQLWQRIFLAQTLRLTYVTPALGNFGVGGRVRGEGGRVGAGNGDVGLGGGKDVEHDMVKRRNAKYRKAKDSKVLTYGAQEDFYKGLDRYYGKPIGGDVNVQLRMMELEFVTASSVIDQLQRLPSDSGRRILGKGAVDAFKNELSMGNLLVVGHVKERLKDLYLTVDTDRQEERICALEVELEQHSKIRTTNYGGIETDLRTEWDFVVNPTEDFITKFMGDDKLNSRGKDHNDRLFPKRHPVPIQKLLTHAMGRAAGLTKAEAIGIRLYTGPSYYLLNSSLRAMLEQQKVTFSSGEERCKHCPLTHTTSQQSFHASAGRFTATASAINSGLKKLACVTPLALNRLLYRGISNAAFPDELLAKESMGKSIFVETSFSSATPNLEVALQYACYSKEHEASSSTLLEIQTGGIDRGCDLSWVSQFPQECEHTILPLSAFEVVKMRVESKESLKFKAELQQQQRVCSFLNACTEWLQTNSRTSYIDNRLNPLQSELQKTWSKLEICQALTYLDKLTERLVKNLNRDNSLQTVLTCYSSINKDGSGKLDTGEYAAGKEHVSKLEKEFKSLDVKNGAKQHYILQKMLVAENLANCYMVLSREAKEKGWKKSVLEMESKLKQALENLEELEQEIRFLLDVSMALQDAAGEYERAAQNTLVLTEEERAEKGGGSFSRLSSSERDPAESLARVVAQKGALRKMLWLTGDAFRKEMGKGITLAQLTDALLDEINASHRRIDVEEKKDEAFLSSETEAEKEQAVAQQTLNEYVNVLTVKLNVNLRAQTSEERVENRKTSVLDLYWSFKLEAYNDRYCGEEVMSALDNDWFQKHGKVTACQFLQNCVFKDALEQLLHVWDGAYQKAKEAKLHSLTKNLHRARSKAKVFADLSMREGTQQQLQELQNACQELEKDAAPLMKWYSPLSASKQAQKDLGFLLQTSNSSDPNHLQMVLDSFEKVSALQQLQLGAEGLILTLRTIRDHGLKDNSAQNAERVMQHVVEKALVADPSLPFFLGSDAMHEMLTLAGSAPGLRWDQVGTDVKGDEIEDEALAEALARQTSFTSQELGRFNALNLSYDSLVRVDDTIWKPVYSAWLTQMQSKPLFPEERLNSGRWEVTHVQDLDVQTWKQLARYMQQHVYVKSTLLKGISILTGLRRKDAVIYKELAQTGFAKAILMAMETHAEIMQTPDALASCQELLVGLCADDTSVQNFAGDWKLRVRLGDRTDTSNMSWGTGFPEYTRHLPNTNECKDISIAKNSDTVHVTISVNRFLL